MEAAAFAGHEVGHVDRLLDVAARLPEHLAHLARHVARVLLLALDQQLRRLEDDLAALGRGRQPPAFVRGSRGPDGGVDILRVGILEQTDDITRVGRIDVRIRIATAAGDPLAADEIEVCSSLGHPCPP